MYLIDNTVDVHLTNTAVTIGKFDGLHIGHKLLLDKLNSLKEERGLTTLILTFDFQPQTVLAGKKIAPIYTWDQEFSVLETEGPEIVVRYPFTTELAAMGPEDFIREILVNKLGCKAVVVGDDFRFGYERAGTPEILQEFGPKYGYETFVIERLRFEGEAVSSTRIRDLLDRGDVAGAEAMLGRSLKSNGESI